MTLQVILNFTSKTVQSRSKAKQKLLTFACPEGDVRGFEGKSLGGSYGELKNWKISLFVMFRECYNLVASNSFKNLYIYVTDRCFCLNNNKKQLCTFFLSTFCSIVFSPLKLPFPLPKAAKEMLKISKQRLYQKLYFLKMFWILSSRKILSFNFPV